MRSAEVNPATPAPITRMFATCGPVPGLATCGLAMAAVFQAACILTLPLEHPQGDQGRKWTCLACVTFWIRICAMVDQGFDCSAPSLI
mmetsp:Transcript_19010/g.53228  ORF Transcript_19010/g.53228 Transcript_19010/m.53228 type:complete len:88 (+) Transcript_19010:499-762(+)